MLLAAHLQLTSTCSTTPLPQRMRWWRRRRGGEGSEWRQWRRRRGGGWALPARSSCAVHSAVCAASAFMANPCLLQRPSPPPPDRLRPSRPLRRGIGSFSRGQRSTSESASEAPWLRAANAAAAIGGGRCGWSGRAGLVPPPPRASRQPGPLRGSESGSPYQALLRPTGRQSPKHLMISSHLLRQRAGQLMTVGQHLPSQQERTRSAFFFSSCSILL